MGRRIVSETLHTAGGGGAPDAYTDRVVKYIPADVVAAWVAAVGIIKSANIANAVSVLWIASAFGLVMAAAWTWKQTSKGGGQTAYLQIAISTVAFAIWVFALGGSQFEIFGWYNPVYGSLGLIAYTLAVGLVVPD